MTEAQARLEEIGKRFLERGLLFAAEEAWTRWLAAARDRGAAPEIIRALRINGALQLALHRVEAGLALLQEARELMEGAPLPAEEQVKVLANVCEAYRMRGQLDQALAAAGEAREICRAGCHLLLRGYVVEALSVIHMARGNWEEALAACREAMEIYGRAEHEVGLWQVEVNLGFIMLEQEHYEAAREHLQRALAKADRLADESKKAYLYTEMGRLSFRTGDAAAAVAYGSQALEVLWSNMALMDKEEIARLSELFGTIAWISGDRQTAINDLQRASTYYAHRHMWREWAAVNRQLDAWVRAGMDAPRKSVAVSQQAKDRLRYFTTLLSLMDSLESLFPEMRGKADLSMKYALLLGDAVGLGDEEREALGHASRLHDIGLTSIDAEVVRGTEPLSPQARERLEAHPLLGEQLLSLFPVPRACLEAVKHHHERFDGTGYPEGLNGRDIPLLARIIAVSDAYVASLLEHAAGEHPDAGAAAPLTHSRALERIQRRAGRDFDPEIVRIFVNLHKLEECTALPR